MTHVPWAGTTYIPRYLCSPVLSSPVPMFPGAYVPRYLCSPIPMFPIFMVTKFQYTAVLEYMCFYLFGNDVDIIISGLFLLLFSVHKVLCNRESNGDLPVHGHIVWVPQICWRHLVQGYSVRAPGARSDRVRSMYNTISITHERRTESLDKLILSTHCFEVEPEHQVYNRL